MHSTYLLTGSNQGDRQLQLSKCIDELNENAGLVQCRSALYETQSWGNEDLPCHLNQALLLQTSLSPLQLLGIIHNIENSLGRIRTQKWGIRAIDIDIIYFDDIVVNHPQLIIPHPLVHLRRFALTPLAEIAPDYQHPVLLKTNKSLLSACPDGLNVTPQELQHRHGDTGIGVIYPAGLPDS